jgi:hypothetical protein
LATGQQRATERQFLRRISVANYLINQSSTVGILLACAVYSALGYQLKTPVTTDRCGRKPPGVEQLLNLVECCLSFCVKPEWLKIPGVVKQGNRIREVSAS